MTVADEIRASLIADYDTVYAAGIEAGKAQGSGGRNILPQVISGSATDVLAEDIQGATAIANDFFFKCTSLTSIAIPDSVTSIGANSFYDCTGLTELTFVKGSQCKTIETGAFRGCKSLKEIILPEGLEVLGNYVFYGCMGIRSLTLPASVKSIGTYAFREKGMTALTVLADTPPSIQSNSLPTSAYTTAIYVPAKSLEAYKSATNWSALASKI